MAPRTRSLVLASLLVLVSAVAQAPSGAQAQVGGSTVNPGVLISGIARCTNAPAPPIPDASLQLVCSGSEVAGAAADDNGAFIIYLEPPTSDELLADLLDNKGKVVVTTPFIGCALPQIGLAPRTTLAAPLQLLSASLGTGVLVTTIGGHLVATVGGIINFIAVLF